MDNILLAPNLSNWAVSMAVPLLVGSALFMRLLLSGMGQTWVRTYAHTATFLLLPVTTYVITTVISGNIALSLGMVGALSIVRFRNPVKSPLELAMFFLLVTMGIAGAVNPVWVVILGAIFFFVLIGIELVQSMSLRLFKRPLYAASFTEGNMLSVLEVTCKKPEPDMMQNRHLVAVSSSEDKQVYRFLSANHATLKDIVQTLDKNKNVTTYHLTIN